MRGGKIIIGGKLRGNHGEERNVKKGVNVIGQYLDEIHDGKGEV